MKTHHRIAAVGAAALALGVVPASPALATSDGARTANPAQACKAIASTLAMFEIPAPDFDVKACIRTVAARVPDLEGAGNPYEQCARLEEGIDSPFGRLQITYPYTFHDAPGDPFPDLTAHNRTQCARALYAFHTIESYLPMGPPPA